MQLGKLLRCYLQHGVCTIQALANTGACHTRGPRTMEGGDGSCKGQGHAEQSGTTAAHRANEKGGRGLAWGNRPNASYKSDIIPMMVLCTTLGIKDMLISVFVSASSQGNAKLLLFI